MTYPLHRILVNSIFIISITLGNELLQVKIKQGVIRGKIVETEQGRSYYSFTGIPYAEPPVGELRFEPPIPVRPWRGVLNTTKPHNFCPQPNTFSEGIEVIGNEDCLYLNVYSPQSLKSENKLLSVMVFIHGGSWFTGGARNDLYDPEYFMTKNIVLVTINYRLGALGFLTTGDHHLPGNNGLKDQALALLWTKFNIRQFGGDSNKITIFGHSAGGASAHYHMLSPLSKSLINGVIAQSGTAFNSWALSPVQIAVERAKALANFCDCNNFETKQMLSCLKQVDAYEIVKQTAKLWKTDMDPMVIFKPVIEPTYVEGTFLSEDPLNIIQSGKAADVPFITGITTEDGAFRTAILYKQPELLEKLDKNFSEMGPLMLMYDETLLPKYKNNINDRIRKFYFGNGPIDESTTSVFTKMYTDAVFLLGAAATVELHSKYFSKPVYYYLFGYSGTEGNCRETSKNYGVCHGDEMLYLFKNHLRFPNYKPSEEDRKITELLTTLWTNFAKEGNPTPHGYLKKLIEWIPAHHASNMYYFINRTGEVSSREGLNTERAKFWKELPFDYRRIRIRDEL